MSETDAGVHEVWHPQRDVPGELHAWLQGEVEAAICEYVEDGSVDLWPPSMNEAGRWQISFRCGEAMEHAELAQDFEEWLLGEVRILDRHEAEQTAIGQLRGILSKALQLLDRPDAG